MRSVVRQIPKKRAHFQVFSSSSLCPKNKLAVLCATNSSTPSRGTTSINGLKFRSCDIRDRVCRPRRLHIKLPTSNALLSNLETKNQPEFSGEWTKKNIIIWNWNFRLSSNATGWAMKIWWCSVRANACRLLLNKNCSFPIVTELYSSSTRRKQPVPLTLWK